MTWHGASLCGWAGPCRPLTPESPRSRAWSYAFGGVGVVAACVTPVVATGAWLLLTDGEMAADVASSGDLMPLGPGDCRDAGRGAARPAGVSVARLSRGQSARVRAQLLAATCSSASHVVRRRAERREQPHEHLVGRRPCRRPDPRPARPRSARPWPAWPRAGRAASRQTPRWPRPAAAAARRAPRAGPRRAESAIALAWWAFSSHRSSRR